MKYWRQSVRGHSLQFLCQSKGLCSVKAENRKRENKTCRASTTSMVKYTGNICCYVLMRLNPIRSNSKLFTNNKFLSNTSKLNVYQCVYIFNALNDNFH